MCWQNTTWESLNGFNVSTQEQKLYWFLLEKTADVKESQTEHRTTCGKIKKQKDRPVLKFMNLTRVLKGLQVELFEE